jgi:hypothetical protein
LPNSTWADEANACVNAISVLSAAPNAYLISVDRVSPVSANALGIVVIVVSVFGTGLMIAGNSP